MKTSPATWRAFIASIVHACHVPLSEIALLTDRQLVDIYAHERDDKGDIKMPAETVASPADEPASLERDLRDLNLLAGITRMPVEQFQELKVKLQEKWAAKTEGKGDG